MSQMAACRKEVTDLRRQVWKEEQSAILTVNSGGGTLQEHAQTTPAGGPPSQPVVGDIALGGSEQARPHSSGTFREIGPCHRCGVEGHWARSCPQKRRGNSGMTPAVPEDKKSAQQEPKVQVVGEKDRKKITYLIIDYKGKKISALLDTGCEVSIVGRRILPADVELLPPTRQLFAANRTRIPLLGSMNMQFAVREEIFSVTLAVTDAIDELILGIDWLSQNTAEWDFGKGELTLRGKRHPLQKKPAMDRVRRVYAADTVSISPMTQVEIPVKVTWPTLKPEESDWIVEPTALKEGLIVARTLVSGEALDTAVRVINVSDRECIIRCEDELGSASKATIMIDEVKRKPSLLSGTPPVEDRAVRRRSRGRSSPSVTGPVTDRSTPVNYGHEQERRRDGIRLCSERLVDVDPRGPEF